MLSSSTVLFPPKLSVKFNNTSTPRVRLHPPLAAAATASTSTLSSQQMASCASLYEILGIPTGASCQEIKAAYRQLARICHPDVAAIDRRDSSADKFIKIHAAYCTLSDPQKRAVYDQKLFRSRRRPLTAAGMSGYSGYSPGRNWETDQCW